MRVLRLFIKNKTETLIFVLEAPRDKDFVLEDNITANTAVDQLVLVHIIAGGQRE